MSSKQGILIGGLVGALLLLLIVFMGPALKPSPSDKPPAWNQGEIKATYVGTQLREIDKGHSSLTISYDLENSAGSDYRLANDRGVVILCRLKADGSLSQEESIRLSYPVFLPAGQRARLAIEIAQPFAWPTSGDASSADKLRDLVRRSLENVGAFVLFDEANRRQLELPSAWKDLSSSVRTY